MIEIIDIPPGLGLEDYAAYAHLAAAVHELRLEAEEMVPHIAPRTVWMVNSTAKGGGVAEMLPRQIAILRELGVDARWLVMGTDRVEFFDLTKRLHNLIHGAGTPFISPEDGQLYSEVSETVARELEQHVSPGDIVVVHDPQPAGAGALLRKRMDVYTVWRCHIGLDEQTPQTDTAWSFLEPYVESYDHTIFTAPEYIPRFLTGKVSIIAPAIDPLTDKNRPLNYHKVTGVLCSSGLARAHTPVLADPFAHQVERLGPDGAFHPPDGPDEIGLTSRPIITQVSRWDRLKGWAPLLDAFVVLKRDREKVPGLSPRERRRLDLCRLVLAGPEPSAVADDPEAMGVLDDLRAAYLDLPEEIQADVVLLSLPMSSLRENALMVNALQNCSTVVVQNSLREGFGLTVTEAMWKAVPVIGAPACGIRQQIRDGIDGHLHHDAEDVPALATKLVEVLADARNRDVVGRRGQRRVHDDFLIFGQTQKWLRALDRAVRGTSVVPERHSVFPDGE